MTKALIVYHGVWLTGKIQQFPRTAFSTSKSPVKIMRKPDYCVFCREAVERDVWRLWTSNRCCENCEYLEDGGRFWKPVAAGALLFVGGIFAGQVVQQKPLPPVIIAKQEVAAAPSPQKLIVQTPSNVNIQNLSSASVKTAPSAAPLISQSPAKIVAPPLVVAENSADETAFYCGARTQKGAPCSRRVKGGGRCWQHAGKAAMLPDEKLRIR